MNKNKGFSLIEVLVSFFILSLVLIFSIKLNIIQLKSFKKIKNGRDKIYFINSLTNYVKKNKDIITVDKHLYFNNYESFLEKFEDFKNIYENKNNEKFEIKIDIENTEIDFYCKKVQANIGTVLYTDSNKTFSSNFISFEE